MNKSLIFSTNTHTHTHSRRHNAQTENNTKFFSSHDRLHRHILFTKWSNLTSERWNKRQEAQKNGRKIDRNCTYTAASICICVHKYTQLLLHWLPESSIHRCCYFLLFLILLGTIWYFRIDFECINKNTNNNNKHKQKEMRKKTWLAKTQIHRRRPTRRQN